MESQSWRPIRIANASGAVGDGVDQLYRLAKDGDVNAITADCMTHNTEFCYVDRN